MILPLIHTLLPTASMSPRTHIHTDGQFKCSYEGAHLAFLKNGGELSKTEPSIRSFATQIAIFYFNPQLHVTDGT